MPITLGAFGGFKVGELVLIADSFLAVGLLYGRRKAMPPEAGRLLYLLTGTFLVGLALASAANDRVDGRIFAYHALWHLVGAFGFMVLWAMNYVRFGPGAEGDRRG